MTKLILALNVDTFLKARRAFQRTKGWIDVYKIGCDLFLNTGSRLVKYLKDEGAQVFVDLKFHDIPNVVAKAACACAKMKADMLTVHTTGGMRMMTETLKTLSEFVKKKHIKTQPQVFGVTVLTSFDEPSFVEVFNSGEKKISEQVVHLAQLAKNAGLSGIVCSPNEISAVKKTCGKDFLVITPGIRIPGEPITDDDQARSLTPGEAAKRGADFLVIGRPILQAIDPVEVIEKIKEDIEKNR